MAVFFAVSSTVAWTPLSLSGLRAWYQANPTDVTVSGSNVTAWADKSGNHVDLQPYLTPVYEPTGFNGKPTVHVNKPAGGYSVLWSQQGAMNVGANCPTFSAFFVGQYIVAPVDGRMIAFVDSTAGDATWNNLKSSIILDINTTFLSMYMNSTSGGSLTTAINTNYRLGTVVNGTTCNTYLNSTTASGYTITSPSYGGASGLITLSLGAEVGMVGSTATLSGSAVEMLVSEVVICNTALSSTDITNLDNYFKTQWGL